MDGAHTPVLQREESTTASDRGAFTTEAPRNQVEAGGQAGPRAWAMPGR
jgi:hypothetical protein